MSLLDALNVRALLSHEYEVLLCSYNVKKCCALRIVNALLYD